MFRRCVLSLLILAFMRTGALCSPRPYYTGEVLPKPQQVVGDWRLLHVSPARFEVRTEAEASGAVKLARQMLLERVRAFADEEPDATPNPVSVQIILGTFDQQIVRSADEMFKLGLGKLILPSKGYAIRIVPGDDGAVVIVATGQGDRGAFYAASTLLQQIGIEGGRLVLKCADINDWPHWQRLYVMDYGPARAEHLRTLASFKIHGYGIQHRYEWRKFRPEERKGRITYGQGLSEMAEFRKQTGLMDYMLLLQIYAHSGKEYPVIDITKDKDVADLAGRCRYAADHGFTHVMILADDWTPSLKGRYVCAHESEKERFGDSVGRAHGYLMRRLYEILKPEYPHLELSICPAPYSLAHVYRGSEARNPEMVRYLRDLAAEMPPDVAVVWTGPRVCSPSIEREHFLEFSRLVGNHPTFLWDNSNCVDEVRGVCRFVTKRYDGFATDSNGIFYLNGFALGWPWQRPYCLNAADRLWNPEGFDVDASYKQAVNKTYGPGTHELVEEYRRHRSEVNKVRGDERLLEEALGKVDDVLKRMEQRRLYTKRFRRDLEQQKGYLNLKLPEARVSRFGKPPRLDGKLEDGCWKAADRMGGFSPLGEQKDLQQTEVMLGYDNDSLYVAFVCHHKESIPDPAVKGRRDGHIYLSSDAVGMMLQPPGASYAHLITDYGGNVFDELGSGGLKWDPEWHAVAHKQKNAWTVEIRIPFASLQALPLDELPTKGAVWRANFIRYYDAAGQNSTWSSTHQNRFHRPEFFGVLKFQ